MRAEGVLGSDRKMCAEAGITDAEFERRKRYLEFDAEDERRLRGLHGLAGEYAEPIIDRFYDHLLSFDETRAFVKRVMLSWHEYRRLYGPSAADQAAAEEASSRP